MFRNVVDKFRRGEEVQWYLTENDSLQSTQARQLSWSLY